MLRSLEVVRYVDHEEEKSHGHRVSKRSGCLMRCSFAATRSGRVGRRCCVVGFISRFRPFLFRFSLFFSRASPVLGVIGRFAKFSASMACCRAGKTN